MFFEFRTFMPRVPHIPAGAVSQVAAEAGVLLLKYNTSLQLWRLGQNPATLLYLLSTTALRRISLWLIQCWGSGTFWCGSVPLTRVADPDWIRIQSGQWIRIRIRNPELCL
jgi:hypothetical protein